MTGSEQEYGLQARQWEEDRRRVDDTKDANPYAIDIALAAMARALGDEAVEELRVLEADAQLAESRADDMSWLPEWCLRKLAEFVSAEEAIKEHSAKLLKQVDTRRRSLLWKWGRQVNAQVNADLRAQGGKKKSFQYATGRAGYRTNPSRDAVAVTDEPVAMAAAARQCPEAIKVTRKLLPSELQKHLKATGEILPGTAVTTKPAERRFFIGATVLRGPELPMAEPEASPRQSAEEFLGTAEHGGGIRVSNVFGPPSEHG